MSRLTIVCLPTLFALALFVCPALAEPETCWIPQFVNCPDTLTMNHCDSISYRFKAVNPHSGKPDHAIRYHLVWGPGQIDSLTGKWTAGPIEYPGPMGVEISASHGSRETSGAENCLFVLDATDRWPWLAIGNISFGDTLDLQSFEIVRYPIAYGDSDLCDQPRVYTTGSASVYPSIKDTGENLIIEVLNVATESVERVNVLLHSGPKMIIQPIYLRLHPRPPMVVRLPNLKGVLQGDYVHIDVSFDSKYQQIGGYNLLITYDNSALAFQSATMGSAFGAEGCSWEYFTYRYGAEGNCPSCPTGLIRVVGMAETNNGPSHPLCNNPDSLPATLFTLNFLTSIDRTLECALLPIRFFWLSCEDNMMISHDGWEDYISSSLADFDDIGRNIANPFVGFPTYLGAQITCDTIFGTNRPAITREIAFVNGFVEFRCQDEWDLRGDVNLNGLGFEVADYVNFVQYFERGLAAFTINVNGQIAATDVNHDGGTLSLTDLISMNRVIRGELTPPVNPPRISPNVTRILHAAPGVVDVVTSDTLAALFFIFMGDVSPVLMQTGPELTYRFDGTRTRVLIAPRPGESADIMSGLVLSNTAGHALLFSQAATKWGDSVNVMYGSITDIGDNPTSLPTAFALHPNYPNPFNASTVISFDLPRAENVTLDIVNLLGQRVYTRTAQYNQGTHNFTWDGTDNSGRTVASGVYYFRLTAGEYSATQKMMLLK